ncbi:MAG: hypothetical protein ACJAR3_003099, partial [Roseivirga sp.]
MNKKYLAVGVSMIGLLTLIIVLYNSRSVEPTPVQDDFVVKQEAELIPPEYKFGISLDAYKTLEGKIKRNETIADILLPYNISNQDVFSLDKLSKDVFSVRKFITNKEYTLFYTEDSLKKAAFFVYEPNPLEYVIYQLQDSIVISKES